MVKNLAKTPLTAILFAAIWCFAAPFFPISESYGTALAEFTFPLLGYAYIVAYGLWLSLILALIISNARGKGLILILLTAAATLLTQWVVPNYRLLLQFFGGTATGAMTFTDFLFWSILQDVAAAVFLFILAGLLFHAPLPPPEPPRPPNAPPRPPVPPDKYKLKIRNFIITLVVLPVIYMVMHFITQFFILYRSEAIRAFYEVDKDIDTFAEYIVDIMLQHGMEIPFALITGLATILPLLLLLFQFAHKRVMFIILAVMLLLGPVVRMLIPTAVLANDVRLALLINTAIITAVYGGLSAFMLHICVYKVQPPAPAHPMAPPQAKGKKGAEAAPEAEPAPEADAKGKGKGKKGK